MVGGGSGAEPEQAILDATPELLTEASHESLTIDAVAARDRSSKTTIYRRPLIGMSGLLL